MAASSSSGRRSARARVPRRAARGLAARSLERTSRGVAEIAAEVGYESEAAFNRAFKREFGLPPGRYRSDRKELARHAEARGR